MTRSHKYNDRHSHEDGEMPYLEPKYFAKHGFADADPNKVKKEGAGRGNWGEPGAEAQDFGYTFAKNRRRAIHQRTLAARTSRPNSRLSSKSPSLRTCSLKKKTWTTRKSISVLRSRHLTLLPLMGSLSRRRSITRSTCHKVD